MKILHTTIVKQEYYCFHTVFTEKSLQKSQTVFRCVGKIPILSDDYHDIRRLLLLTIIVSSKIGRYRLLYHG